MSGPFRITEVFAFIVVGADGDEGVPAIPGGGGLPTAWGVAFTLARFSVREDLEVFGTKES